MKNLLSLVLVIIGVNIGHSQTYTNQTRQAVLNFKQPVTTSSGAINDPAVAHISVNYFDGLGRPVQQIDVKNSPQGKDIVKHIEYTLNGDVVKDFLPVPLNSNSGAVHSNVLNSTLTYYNSPAFEGTNNPYSEKVLEKSPERRLLAYGAPGNSWNPAVADNHALKYEYKTNVSSEVKKYTVATAYNSSLGTYQNSISLLSGTYGANELYKTILKDENWTSGKNNTTEEFVNKLGQTILKRTYNNDIAYDTYYLYDKFGNLVYVVPPLATGVSQKILDMLCYQYTYDYRNRLVHKKLPGKETEYLVYDNADRLVAQGPVLNPLGNASKGWIITKYDVFDRPVYTTFYSGATDVQGYTYLKDLYKNQMAFNESKLASPVSIDGKQVQYSNNVQPNTGFLLTVTYYDDYNYPNAPASFTPVEGVTPNIRLNGMITGNWDRILDAFSGGLRTYYLYDDKYRIISTSTGEVTSSGSSVLSKYHTKDNLFSFDGLVLKTVTRHRNGLTGPAVVVTEKFDYDTAGRLLKHTHQINQQPEELLAFNIYDDLGRLVTKRVGGTDISGSNSLQKVDYGYTIRGWLTNINKVRYSAQSPDFMEQLDDLWGMEMVYNNYINNPEHKALYNGNISALFWKSKTGGTNNGYTYKYDALNRLTDAKKMVPGSFMGITTYTTSEGYKEQLSYDKNGNILTLNRTGKEEAGQVIDLDELTYTYQGNQLLKVTDVTNNPEGFKDGNTTGNDYTYDSLGNLKTDKNKGVTDISYNHLNLPVVVAVPEALDYKLNFLYTATGVKLSKTMTPGRGFLTTYDHEFQYENGNLRFFHTAEGFAEYKNNQYIYHYIYRDHLGNNRLVYADLNKNGVIEAATEIIEENNYYPFGLPHQGYNELATSEPSGFNYKFGGKELQDELELNLYDFGARNYEPALGRWMNVDPLAEQFQGWSPYNYTMNNPLNLVDPTGMVPEAPDHDYRLNKNGVITKIRDTKDNFDRIYNESGKDNIAVGKDFLDKSFLYNGRSTVYPMSNLKEGMGDRIFKFFANNTKYIEYGFNEFLDRSTNTKSGFLITSFDKQTISYGPKDNDLISSMLRGDSSLKLIHSTHSHPYPTLLGKEWGYNPAFPSGFTWKLNTIDESGDRMYFSELKNEFRGRVPNFFELYIPHHDEIKIKYNHEKVIRTGLNTN